jgi:hypothetical protein
MAIHVGIADGGIDERMSPEPRSQRLLGVSVQSLFIELATLIARTSTHSCEVYPSW